MEHAIWQHLVVFPVDLQQQNSMLHFGSYKLLHLVNSKYPRLLASVIPIKNKLTIGLIQTFKRYRSVGKQKMLLREFYEQFFCFLINCKIPCFFAYFCICKYNKKGTLLDYYHYSVSKSEKNKQLPRLSAFLKQWSSILKNIQRVMVESVLP